MINTNILQSKETDMEIYDLEAGDKFKLKVDGRSYMEVTCYLNGELMLEAKYLDGDLEGEHDLVWEDEIDWDTIEKREVQ